MPVFRLDDREISFPPPHLAEPSGLLAIGGDLHPQRLVLAYQHGIFPWFEDEGHFFWYSPDPRCVLIPKELRVHKSMRSIFNQQKFRYTLDTEFERVMQACAGRQRPGQDGSWITDAFVEGYAYLHEVGLAHSVEVWQGDDLVGGLYGIALGKVFFGESMFQEVTNASKAGFIRLVQGLVAADYRLIDCQQETGHLMSLGAKTIGRDLFLEYLAQNRYERTIQGKWAWGADGGIEITPVEG
jgi:leucyl/phenylalanyl-tRNA---protein transferase